MAKQPETKFKERVQKLLKKVPHVWVMKVQQLAKRGDPDLVICVRGHFVAWELKTDEGRPSHLQQYTLESIAKAMGLAWVVTPTNLEVSLVKLQKLAQTPVRTLNELEYT